MSNFKVGDRVVIVSKLDKLRCGTVVSITPTGRANVELDSWNNSPYRFVRQFNKEGFSGKGYFREEIRIATPEDEEKARQNGVIARANKLIYDLHKDEGGMTYERAVKLLEIFRGGQNGFTGRD